MQVEIVSIDTTQVEKGGSTSTIITSNDCCVNGVRGIKVKEKLTRKSSKRLQSGLEKATKKRKIKHKPSCPEQSIQVHFFYIYIFNFLSFIAS